MNFPDKIKVSVTMSVISEGAEYSAAIANVKEATCYVTPELRLIGLQTLVGPAGPGYWGEISGTLSAQTDLQTALDAKANTGDLGSLAYRSNVDYLTDVTNTPVLGTMSAEDASDYYTKTATDALLLEKADVINTSETASIVSVPDGTATPVTGLSVGIEPVQDLHGYSNPWPAGGGKNKFQMHTLADLKTINTSGTWSNNVYSINGIDYTINDDGTIKANGTASGVARINLAFAEDMSQFSGMVMNGVPAYGGESKYYMRCQQPTSPYTTYGNDYYAGATLDTIPGNANLFIIVASGATVTNILFKPMIRLSSEADDTYAPYSNVCPITGWSEAKVTRTGRNLCGSIYSNASRNRYISVLYCDFDLRPDTQYTVSFAGTLGNKYYTNETIDSVYQTVTVGSGRTTFTFRTKAALDKTSNLQYTTGKGWIILKNVQDQSADNVFTDVQVEYGSTATSYEEYSGISFTIDLNGTRYSGTLDVLSGTLTVDRAMVDMGQINWGIVSGVADRYYSPGLESTAKPSASGTVSSLKCSHLKTDTYNRCWSQTSNAIIGINASADLCVSLTGYADATAFKTAMSGVTLCYELATPTTVQLTAQQLTMLTGNNTVWADTGDTSIVYRADTKTFISDTVTETKALLSPNIITEMVAPKNLTANEFVVLGNNLYKVTQNVASGAQLTVGTNVTAVTIAEVLTTLLNSI